MGLKIGEQRLYPKPTRPRPPPSKRGYLPNFPVAATEHDLETAATERGINVIKITPRLYKETAIKVGGWTIWGDMDSAMPVTVCFDGEEYAVLWRGRRPPTTTTTTTSKRTTNTVTNDNDTGRMAVSGAASGGQTDHTEPTKETTPRDPTNAKSDDDVDMELVVSKLSKKRQRKRERQAATKSTIETKNHNNTNNNNNAKRNTEKQTKRYVLGLRAWKHAR